MINFNDDDVHRTAPSLKPTTIPNDRGVRGGPSHNHIRFIQFNFFPDGHVATTSER